MNKPLPKFMIAILKTERKKLLAQKQSCRNINDIVCEICVRRKNCIAITRVKEIEEILKENESK